MSGPGNAMNRDSIVGQVDSTESSLYTESTESRIPCNAQPRQTARILLEKRRQELPKMSPIEQAYMRNSKKQVPYHPLKQPAPSGIIQTIKATHTNRIRQLENQVAEDQIKINEYVTELRTMKTQQKRLEIELKRYQGMAGNIPTFMHGQKEELRAAQHELKKAKLHNSRLGQNLALREDELNRVKQENQRWRRLEDVMELEDREKLFEENEHLKHRITRQNDKIMMLTRKGMLEVKNLKYELGNERKKHRATQQCLAKTLESGEKMRSDLELKQKYITYNSLRFASHQKKQVPNGLESISLITLAGNRFGSVQTPMKLDPELVRHYPKTPVAAKPADRPANDTVSSAYEARKNTPVLLERVTRDKSDHIPKKITNNSPIKTSPPIPLPKIQNADEDDGSLSDRSDMSEEDIHMYSSSIGSHSRRESPITDSRKSSLDFRRDCVDGTDSDSEVPDISKKTKKNGLSLPNLVAKDGNGDGADGDGKQSQVKRERGSRGERRISVEEKSLTLPKSQNRSPAEESSGKQSRTPNGKKNVLVLEKRKPATRESPPMTREQKLAKEYAEIEEKVRCEKIRSETIKMEYEGFLKFDSEIKQDIDQVSKGKLLAALNAIEKGGDPVKISPFKRGPKQATIFTATKARSPAVPFDQVTEDLHHGRPTRRNESPEDKVQLTALDLFKSDSPPEHPMTKSELIKELFGGGNGVDYAPAGKKVDITAPIKNSMSFERVGFSDRNNNEPPEANGFYPARRVSLTNWKH